MIYVIFNFENNKISKFTESRGGRVAAAAAGQGSDGRRRRSLLGRRHDGGGVRAGVGRVQPDGGAGARAAQNVVLAEAARAPRGVLRAVPAVREGAQADRGQTRLQPARPPLELGQHPARAQAAAQPHPRRSTHHRQHPRTLQGEKFFSPHKLIIKIFLIPNNYECTNFDFW
jgi:hypothetical protein